MRFLTPALLLGAAVVVHHYNGTHTDSVLLFPFVDKVVPSTQGNPTAMGAVSVKILAGLGVLSLLLNATQALRGRAQD